MSSHCPAVLRRHSVLQDVFDKDVFQNDFMGSVPLTVDDIKEAAKVQFFLQFILFPKLKKKLGIHVIFIEMRKGDSLSSLSDWSQNARHTLCMLFTQSAVLVSSISLHILFVILTLIIYRKEPLSGLSFKRLTQEKFNFNSKFLGLANR